MWVLIAHRKSLLLKSVSAFNWPVNSVSCSVLHIMGSDFSREVAIEHCWFGYVAFGELLRN